MTEVITRLWIGSWRDAEERASAMHVVTVAHDSPFTGIAKFGLIDGPGNAPELLNAAADHVCEAYEGGATVLVHCHGGRSRSAAVIVLALSKITGKSLCELYDLLANKHDKTRIHPHLSALLFEVLQWPTQSLPS